MCLLVEGLLEALVDKTGEVSRLTFSMHMPAAHVIVVVYGDVDFRLFSGHPTPCLFIIILSVTTNRGGGETYIYVLKARHPNYADERKTLGLVLSFLRMFG